jgi:hypothetical protein
MRGTSLWTMLGIVAVAGAFLSLPGARTDVDAGTGVAIPFQGYRCYGAKNAKGFRWNKTVLYAVTDQLGGANVTTQLTKPAFVCTPAIAQLAPGGVNFTIIKQPLPTIVCFRSKDAKGTPRLNYTSFVAADDLGVQNLTLGKANLFCVPVFNVL